MPPLHLAIFFWLAPIWITNEDSLFCATEMNTLLLLLSLLQVQLTTRMTNDVLVSKILFTSTTSFKNQKHYIKPTKIHLLLTQN